MEKIELSPNPDSGARLVGYLHDKAEEMPNFLKRPCVVVCPGGGYEYCSAREADPVALAFFGRGYNTFILYYSVGKEAAQLRPLTDLSLSVLKIRKNCEEWGILPDKIAVCGFSAGGHLAASLGTLWNSPLLAAAGGGAVGNGNRPDAMILGYPVISAGKYAHKGSLHLVSGDQTEFLKLLSLEKQVTPETPPAFLWHTADDGCVPVQNTLLFAAALLEKGVPFECHIYPHGNHGMSMCTAEVNCPSPHLATWFPLCIEWLENLFGFPS